METRRAELRASLAETEAKNVRRTSAECLRLEAQFASQLKTHIAFSVRKTAEKVSRLEQKFQTLDRMITSVHATRLRAQLREDAGHWAAVVQKDCDATTAEMKEITDRAFGAILRVQRTLAATEARTRRFREVQTLRRRLFLINLSRECADACRAHEDALWARVQPRLTALDKRLAMMSFALERKLVRFVK